MIRKLEVTPGKEMKDKSGTTLIETIMVTVVLAIIAATVTGVVIFFVQLFLYSPRQLGTQKIGQELSNIIFEGDQNIRGIRYTRTIIDASSAQFSYTYGYPSSDDQLSVRFRWNAADKHIYRSTSTDAGVNWSVETVIPYYISSNTYIDDQVLSGTGAVFSYLDAAGNPTAVLSSIRRVVLTINIRTQSGSFGASQGSSNITSSAEVKGF